MIKQGVPVTEAPSLVRMVLGYGGHWLAAVPLLFALYLTAVMLASRGLRGPLGINADVEVIWFLVGAGVFLGGIVLLIGRAALRRWLEAAVVVFLTLAAFLVTQAIAVSLVADNLYACGHAICR